MSLPRYAEYKGSGVEWLGKVPSHWNVMPFKWQILRNDGGAWGGDPLGDSDDTIVLRSTEQTVDGKWKIRNPAVRQLNMSERLATRLRKNDLVVTKSSGSSLHIGKTTLVTSEIDAMECSFGNFMQRIRVKESFHAKLAWYILNNDIARRQLDTLSSSTTGLANLNGTLIGEIILAVPTLDEQQEVANFLDHETAQIDALIEEQQRLIELLKEKRQAVISHAVTKGLDSQVPMKDSGVEWLGKVPIHWEFKKIARAYKRIGSGTTPPSTETHWYDDGAMPWVTTSELRETSITHTKKNVTEAALNSFPSLTQHPPGSLVIAMYGATIGRLGFLKVTATTNQACCVLSEPVSLDPQFTFYWLLAFKETLIRLYATGGGQPNINRETIASFRIAAPLLDEQKRISSMIEIQLESLDELSLHAKQAIGLLQERRSALISAAVTGKIDVRNWQAPAESATETYSMAAEPEAAYEVSRS